MSTKREIQAQAEALRESQPREALELYQKIWGEHREEFNQYDALRSIQCAKNIEEDHLSMVSELVAAFPESDMVLGSAGWYLFGKYFKGKEGHEILDRIGEYDTVLSLLQQQDMSQETQYPCAYTIMIFNILDALTNRIFNGEAILNQLDRLDPSKLSKTPDTYEHPQRGTIEKMSDYEKYFSLKTKALLKEERFEECKEACDLAVQTIDAFHYRNEIWFPMRKALSLEHTGEMEASEAIFQELLESRDGSNMWFLYKDLAELYFEQGAYEKAWKYSLEAAMLGNEAKFLTRLFYLQARIFNKLDRRPEGKIFVEMIAAVLLENEWRVHQNYSRLFDYYKIDYSQSPPIREVQKRLDKFLLQEKYKGQVQVKGNITTIHGNGKSGFIKDDAGNQYFFGKGDLLKKTRNLQTLLNAKVAFYEGKETEKGKKADAVNVLELVKIDKSDLEGKTFTGNITKINELGIFVTGIGDDHGLVHKSKLPSDYEQVYTKWDPVEVIVNRVKPDGKIDLKLANS